MRRLVLAMVLAGSAAWAAPAEAKKQVKFVGMHPIAANQGGGFCYIEVPHVHLYGPSGKAQVLYRKSSDGANHFVGDPVPYGYDGPKHAYYGHHPVNAQVAVEYGGHFSNDVCYLEGPHYHPYPPPAEAKFQLKGGVHFFVGTYPEVYQREKAVHARVNAVHRPLKVHRPVVVVEPPVEYHGPVWVDHHAEVVHHEPAPVVRAGVDVHVSAPSIHVDLPGVIVEGHHVHHKHHKYKHYKHKKYKHGHGHGRGHVRGHGRGHWKKGRH